MKSGWKNYWMWGLMGYSLVASLLMYFGGIWSGIEYAGYGRQFNWSLYPLFWPVIFLLLYASWEPFIRAWRDMVDTGVVTVNGIGKEESKNYLENHLLQKRNLCLFASLIFAVIINFIDTKNTVQVYHFPSKAIPVDSTANGADKSRDISDYPIRDPGMCLLYLKSINSANALITLNDIAQLQKCNITVRQFYYATGALDKLEAYLSRQSGSSFSDIFYLPGERVFYRSGNEVRSVELDWTVAWLAPGVTEEKRISKCFNLFLSIIAYIQQFIISFLAIRVLENMLIHLYYFWRLPKLHFPGITYDIHLDIHSGVGEFGLEYWNQALNNLYWVLTIAIGIPLVSAANQSSDDVGQLMLRLLVPLLFLVPLILTIIVRQQYLPGAWRQVRSGNQDDLYQKQLLWPLDRNWASKLGIILAFVLLSYLVGVSFLDLVKI